MNQDGADAASVPGHEDAPAPLPTAPTVGRSRKWRLRAIGFSLAVLTGVGTWVTFNFSTLRAQLASRRLAAAATDEDRGRWANVLIDYGEPGIRKLVACLQTDAEPVRAAAAAALEQYLSSLPEGDSRAITTSGLLLEMFENERESAGRAVLPLVKTILNRTGSTYALRCRILVSDRLKAHDYELRLAAAQLALHPELRLRAELVPFLNAPEPEMRRTALFAVVTADAEPLLSEEDLFRFLHDPDPGVRKVCHDALVGRDRSDAEIGLARRLTHPDPNERLKLLLDLRYDDDVRDPEPWLERLGRDEEPAIRAGAVRVVVEMAALHSFPCPAWVARIADIDPHATVRFIAGYYRAQATPLHQIRPAGAP